MYGQVLQARRCARSLELSGRDLAPEIQSLRHNLINPYRPLGHYLRIKWYALNVTKPVVYPPNHLRDPMISHAARLIDHLNYQLPHANSTLPHASVRLPHFNSTSTHTIFLRALPIHKYFQNLTHLHHHPRPLRDPAPHIVSPPHFQCAADLTAGKVFQ